MWFWGIFCLVWDCLVWGFFFLFFSMPYTGKVCWHRGHRETSSRTLVPSSNLVIPVLGQEVLLPMLNESQKHLVCPDTD